MEELTRYLKDNFGIRHGILDKINSPNIPLYLLGNYELYQGFLGERKIIWAKVRQEENVSSDQLDKQQKQLKNTFEQPVIFVFDRLESWMRKRLIEREIAFVEVGRQLYVPEFLIQLSDIRHKKRHSEIQLEKLTPPTQCLLLYHLQVQSLENQNFKDISDRLNYSGMTITRAIKELSALKLAIVKGTREKVIEFTAEGRELWVKCLPQLRSPVREEWFTHLEPRIRHFHYGGESALSAYTMLDEGPIRTFTLGKDQFRKELLDGTLSPLYKNLGRYRIEVWHYDPAILAQGDEVDVLSLYLSMHELEDERVKVALDDLMTRAKWLRD